MARLMVIACGVFLACASTRAAPEFVAVMSAPGLELYAVGDPERGEVPRWLSKGQHFGGCVVVEYRAAAETLVVTSQGAEIILPLRQAKIVPRLADAEEMIRLAAQEIARNEQWSARIRFQGPHLFKGEWIVVAHHEANSRFETRVVVFTAAGALKDYLRQ